MDTISHERRRVSNTTRGSPPSWPGEASSLMRRRIPIAAWIASARSSGRAIRCGRSLFSYIIPQHQRTLEWLATLPNVDPERIGFYGLSYGGKTAVRVPTMLPQYALSICSGDFNEWVRKNATNADSYSYVFTPEYEMFEWNMGHVANYAELASLMTPRPFMVERGHDDGVAPDEWVAWEYAKVRRHLRQAGLGGPHRDRILQRTAHHSRPGDVRIFAQAPELARSTSLRLRLVPVPSRPLAVGPAERRGLRSGRGTHSLSVRARARPGRGPLFRSGKAWRSAASRRTPSRWRSVASPYSSDHRGGQSFRLRPAGTRSADSPSTSISSVPPTCRRDDRAARGGRFKQHAAERLLPRTVDEQVDLSQQPLDVGAVAKAVKTVREPGGDELSIDRFVVGDAFRLGGVPFADEEEMGRRHLPSRKNRCLRKNVLSLAQADLADRRDEKGVGGRAPARP